MQLALKAQFSDMLETCQEFYGVSASPCINDEREHTLNALPTHLVANPMPHHPTH
jgi:hypothetical protein